MRILVVDDEPHIRQTLKVALEAMGHSVTEASDSAGTLRQLEQSPCDAMLVDLRLGAESGFDLMEQVLRDRPGLAVVIITAHGTIDRAVEAMRQGCLRFPAQAVHAGPGPRGPRAGRADPPLHSRVADLEEQVRVGGARGGAREPRPTARHDPRAGPAGRRHRRGRADQGRERHGQGRAGQANSRLEPPHRRARSSR